jgi:hypothetical protein
VGNKQTWDILSEHPSWSKLPNKTGEFKPKAAARAFNPGSFPGLREILTGESSAEEVNSLKLGSPAFSNVCIAFYSRPVSFQHFTAERVNLDLPAALETGPVKPKVDAADPRE